MCCQCCKCSRSSPHSSFDAQAAVRKLAESHRQTIAKITDFLSAEKSAESRIKLTAWLTNHSAAIWGGADIDPANDPYPECCAVGRASDSSWFASGVRIHRRVVLTAGHIVSRNFADQVLFNSVNWDQPTESPIQAIFAQQHDAYLFDARYDIAAMILPEDTPEGAVYPVSEIATDNELKAADKLAIVGFGATDSLGLRDDGIKRASPKDLDIQVKQNQRFFAKHPEVDTCRGDSGGPAYIRTSDGKLKLAGVTASGLDDPDRRCGQGGFYTRIDAHWDFIARVARQYGIDLT